jgi:hypothetical protein
MTRCRLAGRPAEPRLLTTSESAIRLGLGVSATALGAPRAAPEPTDEISQE